MSAPQAEAMAEPEKQVPTGTVRVDRDAALGAGLGARAAGGAADGADHGHQRSAHGLSNGVSHARCRGALESGDRRDPTHQPARREVSCAPLAPLPSRTPGPLSRSGLTPAKVPSCLTFVPRVWFDERSRRFTGHHPLTNVEEEASGSWKR